jgi:N-acetylglutamate synthase-like GNAT family acetyltransferase
VIRPARQNDRAGVEALVRAAYEIYIERIGKPPGPMLDDYERRIADNAVHVLDAETGIAALVVLLPQSDHLLVDNIAVRPDQQGRGLGRRLLSFAEDEARRLGLTELRLYTHVRMVENIAYYTRRGFAETGRRQEAGYERVFMRKRLAEEPRRCR